MQPNKLLLAIIVVLAAVCPVVPFAKYNNAILRSNLGVLRLGSRISAAGSVEVPGKLLQVTAMLSLHH